jgi:hypothetical protein
MTLRSPHLHGFMSARPLARKAYRRISSDFLVGNRLGWFAGIGMMSEEEADRDRTEAEERRRLADRAMRQPDKEAWLSLAADWLSLAEGASMQVEGRG